MEVPATSTGILTEIRVGAGEVAPVGAVVAIVAGAAGEPAAKAPAVVDALGAAKAPTKAAPSQNAAAMPVFPSVAATPATPPARVMLDPFREVRTPERNYGPAKLASGAVVTPLARRLAGEAGIDLSRIAAVRPARSHRRPRRSIRHRGLRRAAPRRVRRRRPIASRRSMRRAPTKRCRSTPCGAPSRHGWSKRRRPSRISTSSPMSPSSDSKRCAGKPMPRRCPTRPASRVQAVAQ